MKGESRQAGYRSESQHFFSVCEVFVCNPSTAGRKETQAEGREGRREEERQRGRKAEGDIQGGSKGSLDISLLSFFFAWNLFMGTNEQIVLGGR